MGGAISLTEQLLPIGWQKTPNGGQTMTITQQFFPNATDDRLTKLADCLKVAYGEFIAKGCVLPVPLQTIVLDDKGQYAGTYPDVADDLSRVGLIAIAHLLTSDSRFGQVLSRKILQDIRSLVVDCM